tara:strand:- start:3320 stop:3565 length:246 start_codon:yes stop_codon:yes gene_type:complete
MIALYYLLYKIKSNNCENILWIVKTSDILEELLEYRNNNSKYESNYVVKRVIRLKDKEKELNKKDFKTFVLSKRDIVIDES